MNTKSVSIDFQICNFALSELYSIEHIRTSKNRTHIICIGIDELLARGNVSVEVLLGYGFGLTCQY